jgi:hypothetical protein
MSFERLSIRGSRVSSYAKRSKKAFSACSSDQSGPGSLQSDASSAAMAGMAWLTTASYCRTRLTFTGRCSVPAPHTATISSLVIIPGEPNSRMGR